MASRRPHETPASHKRKTLKGLPRQAETQSVDNPRTPGARVILEAAVSLFSTDGFDSVSIAAIAQKAGVSKANVFHHFASKGELYFAVMQQACTAHANFAEELHSLPISSMSKIRQLIEFELKFQGANLHLAKMTTRELIDGHSRVKQLARNTLHRNFAAVTALVRQGIERGELAATVDPRFAAILIHSTTSYYFITRYVLQELQESSPLANPLIYAEQIADLVLKALTA